MRPVEYIADVSPAALFDKLGVPLSVTELLPEGSEVKLLGERIDVSAELGMCRLSTGFRFAHAFGIKIEPDVERRVLAFETKLMSAFPRAGVLRMDGEKIGDALFDAHVLPRAEQDAFGHLLVALEESRFVGLESYWRVLRNPSHVSGDRDHDPA